VKKVKDVQTLSGNLEFFANLPEDYFTNIMDAALAKCAGK